MNEVLEVPVEEAKQESTDVAENAEFIAVPQETEVAEQVATVQDEVVPTALAEQVTPVQDEVVPTAFAEQVTPVQDEVIPTEVQEQVTPVYEEVAQVEESIAVNE
jgi:hypothetical protein